MNVTPITLHLILSILTLIVLCIAGLQAAVLAVQEKLLRSQHHHRWIQKFPPLMVMERVLFQWVIAGFVLLTLLLSSSVYFFHAILWDRLFIFQKTLTVLMAWVIFLGLLIGRFQRGWRGKKAIYCTLLGVLLLLIVYVSSQWMWGGM